MNMDAGVNKTPVEVIKEGAFGETHFRDIYSDFMVDGTKGLGNNLMN